MKSGGFDAVIGNPPYGASINNSELIYLRMRFTTSNKDLDTYSLFIEQAVRLVRSEGRVSMIVPTGWYSGPKFSSLRTYLAVTTDPVTFISLPYDVFRAWVDTTVFIFKKRVKPTPWPRRDFLSVSLKIFPKRYRIRNVDEFYQNTKRVRFADWFIEESDEFLTYADSASTALIHKIISAGKPLGQMADVQRGVTPFGLTPKAVHEHSRPAFAGTVRRYMLDRGQKCFIRFDESLAELKSEKYFKGRRLLLRELISRQFQLQATRATEDFVTNKSMQSILQVPGGLNLDYLLGIINSRLMSWYFIHRSNVAQRDDFPKIVLKETRALPIRPINLNLGSDKTRYDRVITLVEQIIGLSMQIALAKIPHEKEALQRQAQATDTEIDKIVYQLYGLNPEEIRIVEGA
jgi:hypothetical protein